MSISIVDIKRSIISKLASSFQNHTIYGEKMPTDFKRPSFYIYFIPLESQHNSDMFIDKSVMVKIDYYSPNRTNEENWIMADNLESVFHKDLHVKGRFFSVTRTNSESIDDVLTFTLTVNYDDAVGKVVGIEVSTEVVDENGNPILDEEGNPITKVDTVITEEDEKLGYTEGNVKLMEFLELK